LIPISSHRFITLERYAYIFEFEEKNGKIDAFQEYDFNHESNAWEKDEDWYFKKKKFLN